MMLRLRSDHTPTMLRFAPLSMTIRFDGTIGPISHVDPARTRVRRVALAPEGAARDRARARVAALGARGSGPALAAGGRRAVPEGDRGAPARLRRTFLAHGADHRL